MALEYSASTHLSACFNTGWFLPETEVVVLSHRCLMIVCILGTRCKFFYQVTCTMVSVAVVVAVVWCWQCSTRYKLLWCSVKRWSLLMWEIGRRLGHYGDHPRPQVADMRTPSRVDKRVAPDREGAADKQCQGEGKLWSQYVITNRDESKGKPPRLFPKTEYQLGYPEPAL